MSAEITPDMQWASRQLNIEGYKDYIWSSLLRSASEDMSGLHQVVALILIAKGIETRPIDKVIQKLKKEGLADGAGIDSARNK